MFAASHIDVRYPVGIDAAPGARSAREAAVSAHSDGPTEILPIAPEAIVGELVKQYLHCSTTLSGIFRCW